MTSLPFLVRLIAATILARQNKELIAEVAYLRTEVAYLREQLPAKRVLKFTDAWRKKLARAAAGVGWERMAKIATVAKASTIRGWHRLMAAGKLGVKRVGPGRPQVSKEVEQMVVRLAKENPTWGQVRIRGELLKLEVAVSPRTIAAILDRNGLKPAPQRGTDSTWRSFLAEHLDTVVATDFFTVDVWSWLGKRSYDVLFAIHHGTRRVHIAGITDHANADFMAQTARNDTMADTGWLKQVGAKYLIHDGDGKFCARWQQVLRSGGVEPTKTAPNSPNMNAIAERWVRTVKRECIRRCWFIGRGGLERALADYCRHYNEQRPHQGKQNRALTAAAQAKPPAQKPVTEFKASEIRCETACGGAVRHYYRVAA
jgi:transposase InsO family protein